MRRSVDRLFVRDLFQNFTVCSPPGLLRDELLDARDVRSGDNEVHFHIVAVQCVFYAYALPAEKVLEFPVKRVTAVEAHPDAAADENRAGILCGGFCRGGVGSHKTACSQKRSSEITRHYDEDIVKTPSRQDFEHGFAGCALRLTVVAGAEDLTGRAGVSHDERETVVARVVVPFPHRSDVCLRLLERGYAHDFSEKTGFFFDYFRFALSGAGSVVCTHAVSIPWVGGRNPCLVSFGRILYNTPMDYSFYGLLKKEDELARKKGAVLRHAAVTLAFVAFFAVIAVFACGLCLVRGMVDGIIADAPEVSEINIAPSGFATYIYDSDGNELQKLTSSDSNRTAVSLKNVPVYLQHAVVATEDERFYQHHGVDPRGVLRAAFVGIRNRFRFSEGASTITQQLLKNNVFTTWTEERTLLDRIRRKVQEQYLALKLEERIKDKSLILEYYLNTINLGAGTYGVQAAAKKYFNKDVSELTLSECATLAGITQNPSKYNPITHPEFNAERRERVLTKMLEQNYITQADYDEAKKDAVYDRIAEAQKIGSEKSTVYSWFVDELTRQVIGDLQEKKGLSENQAYQLLYSGGLRIFTTQDPEIQKICDEEYADPENFPEGTQYALDWALSVKHEDGQVEHYSKEMLASYMRGHLKGEAAADFDLLFDTEKQGKKYVRRYKKAILKETDEVIAERMSFAPQPQSSLVLMDQTTGYVKAIIGGRGEKNATAEIYGILM